MDICGRLSVYPQQSPIPYLILDRTFLTIKHLRKQEHVQAPLWIMTCRCSITGPDVCTICNPSYCILSLASSNPKGDLLYIKIHKCYKISRRRRSLWDMLPNWNKPAASRSNGTRNSQDLPAIFIKCLISDTFTSLRLLCEKNSRSIVATWSTCPL